MDEQGPKPLDEEFEQVRQEALDRCKDDPDFFTEDTMFVDQESLDEAEAAKALYQGNTVAMPNPFAVLDNEKDKNEKEEKDE